jgi:hypothetical protein
VLDGLLQQPHYGTHMYITVQERVPFPEFTALADAEGSSNVYFFTNLLNRLKTYKWVTKY